MHVFSTVSHSNSFLHLNRYHVHVRFAFTDFFCDIFYQGQELAELWVEGAPTFKQTNLFKCKEARLLRDVQEPNIAKGCLVCLRKLRQSDCAYNSAGSVYCYIHFSYYLDTTNVLKEAGNITVMMQNMSFPCESHYILCMISVSPCISCYRKICHYLEARNLETTRGLD